MSHRVRVNWAGGEHAFALDLGQLRAVQTACNAGPQRVLMRLMSGDWLVDDPLVICRHGLMGAGMPEDEAQRLVMNAVATGGCQQLVVTAALVLGAALTGDDGDPLEEDPEGKPMGVTTASGGSAESTATAPVPDSPPET